MITTPIHFCLESIEEINPLPNLAISLSIACLFNVTGGFYISVDNKERTLSLDASPTGSVE